MPAEPFGNSEELAAPATPAQVAEIRERLAKVTPGRWKGYLYPQTETFGVESGDGLIVAGNLGVPGNRYSQANTEFIAHAPVDVAQLLALVDQQAAEIARLQAFAASVTQEGAGRLD